MRNYNNAYFAIFGSNRLQKMPKSVKVHFCKHILRFKIHLLNIQFNKYIRFFICPLKAENIHNIYYGI